MKSKTHKIANLVSILILGLSLFFSAFMATIALSSSKELGAGAAQGSLGFYMALKIITPIIIAITTIPFTWGIYSGRSNLIAAFLSWNSKLFYLNAGILAWCWYFDFYVWRN